MIHSLRHFHGNRCSGVEAIHTAVKGRARFKVRGLQGSTALKQYLERQLGAAVGVERVSASADSGNLLVLFNPKMGVGAIARLIQQLLFEYAQVRRPTHPVVHCAGWPATPVVSRLGIPMTAHSSPPEPNSSLSRTPPFVPNPSPALQNPVEPKQEGKLWHLLPADVALEAFQTQPQTGLSNQVAQWRLQRDGPNRLTEAVPRSRWSILVEQFRSLPVALLTTAAGLSVLTGGLVDALVIMGVVGINAAIGYATESQSETIIQSLKHLVRPTALVIREGKVQSIHAEAVVVGDLLVLRPGSYVAADARLIEAKRLSVDESALTGESMPVMKSVEPLHTLEVPLGDRVNMVYMGTLVTGGQGLAVVVATAQNTEMGKIQTLVGTTTPPATPMERQLDQAGSQLVWLSSAVCGLVFGIGLLRGYGWLPMLKTSISLAIAAVPEGLPAVATTTLALGIKDMQKHKVLVRRLEAVEALGSVQSLCLDKTGTLTANRMSVVELQTSDTHLQVRDGHLWHGDHPPSAQQMDAVLPLLHTLVLCNESEINGNWKEQEQAPMLRGSATENALVELALAAGVDVVQVRQRHPLLQMRHRSEDRNYMQTLHALPNHQRRIAVKGSPTEVLALCQRQLRDGQHMPLTDADRMQIELDNERMASNALRVLGAAYLDTDDPDADAANLVWLGLVGMADPIRHGVKDLMATFHRAGIDTIMITGDQSTTAYAIGKELQLSRGEQLQILDSTYLANLEPEMMQALCQRAHIFARISPAHKLQIVQALQRAGRVVAMTGDGINDAPALKAADVGVAMGHTGTDVAREVADVVLEDDDLQTMAIAVSRGRTIYNNIRKSVHFLLSTNLSEIMVMLAGTSLGIGQPLTAMQLLWLNLVTDIFPGLALALEPPEPDVLSQPPRNPADPILRTADFQRIALESTLLSSSALGAYGYGLLRYGVGAQSSAIAFMSLTTAQLLHAISCRSTSHSIFQPRSLPPNRYLAIALAGSLTLQFLTTLVPGLRQLLNIAPLHWQDSLAIGASALLPLLANEATKLIAPQTGTAADPKLGTHASIPH